MTAAEPFVFCFQLLYPCFKFGTGRFPACRGRRLVRWFPSRPDRTGIDYRRRVKAALRTADCATKGGVDGFVTRMGGALNGVPAVQAQLPNHQFM